MKKMWLLSSFIISMIASPVFGEDVECPKGLYRKKQSCGCDSPQMNYRLPADFTGVTNYAEALVWQVQEQASHFVITPNEDSFVDPSYHNTEGLGRVRSAKFDWNGGLRVGMGYTVKRDYWQTLAQYTWFATEGSRTHSINPPTAATTSFLMPTFYVQSQALTDTISAKNKVNFSYQMGDLLLRRSFLSTEQIKMSFAFGGTGGYIREQFHITFEAAGPSANNTYVKNSWSFGGGGFRAGLDSNWHFGKGFGLFGRVSFAAILGHYSNQEKITADGPNLTDDVANHIMDTKYSGVLLMPATQIALGFDWCRTFTNCFISGINIALATELNNLANLHQIFKTTNFPSDPITDKAPFFRDISSVYMYGVNLRLGVDY